MFGRQQTHRQWNLTNVTIFILRSLIFKSISDRTHMIPVYVNIPWSFLDLLQSYQWYYFVAISTGFCGSFQLFRWHRDLCVRLRKYYASSLCYLVLLQRTVELNFQLNSRERCTRVCRCFHSPNIQPSNVLILHQINLYIMFCIREFHLVFVVVVLFITAKVLRFTQKTTWHSVINADLYQ